MMNDSWMTTIHMRGHRSYSLAWIIFNSLFQNVIVYDFLLPSPQVQFLGLSISNNIPSASTFKCKCPTFSALMYLSPNSKFNIFMQFLFLWKFQKNRIDQLQNFRESNYFGSLILFTFFFDSNDCIYKNIRIFGFISIWRANLSKKIGNLFYLIQCFVSEETEISEKIRN